MQKKIYISLILIFLANLSFSQKNQLETPKIDSVSVNHFSKKVTISWLKDTTEKIDGYVIYRARVSDGILSPIDSIKIINKTSYIDKTSNPYNHNEIYSIATYNDTLLSPFSETHNTIFAYISNYDPCNANLTISWNKYIHWGKRVKNYKIFFSRNNSEYQLLATVTDTSYTQDSLRRNKKYSYYIMATSNDGKTSSSNEAVQYTEMPKPPQYIKINSVKVINNSSIKLSYKIDLSADIIKYELLRSENQTNNFDTIHIFEKFTNPLEYTDDNADVNKQYYYKLIAVNICHIKTDSSEIVSNIVLKTKNNDDLTNTLHWNKLFKNTTESYEIYRIIDDGDTTQLPIIEDTNYTDDISNYLQSNVQGKFCYYVEAQINYGEKSRSNISCVYQMPKVYLPNAISPNSQVTDNRTFKPAISFVSPNKYIFIVYNRWGEKIFETKNPNQGWDGKYKGKPVPEGAYMYYIKFYTSKNKLYQKNGQITVFYH